MNRISINALGQPYFELICGDGWYNPIGKSTNGVLMQAVAEGYAKEIIEHGVYGATYKWFTNDGKLIREFYSDYTRGFDTWNSYELKTGIFNLTKEGAYKVTLEDIEAEVIAKHKEISATVH
jgi:hypothetical protein